MQINSDYRHSKLYRRSLGILLSVVFLDWLEVSILQCDQDIAVRAGIILIITFFITHISIQREQQRFQ